MKCERVLMLGAGPLQAPAITALKNLGCYVICADYDPEAIGFSLADEASLTSAVDGEAVLRLACSKRVDYVITSTSDAPVRTAAYVSEKLGLPTGISYANSICATQKDAMRKRLDERGVPIPLFQACRDFDSFMSAVLEFGFNCVVKPADCAASRGVRLLAGIVDSEILRLVFDETLALSKKGVVMVEERIAGPEVSVEAITVEKKTTVLAITDKMVTEPPYLVELGHAEPSSLPVAARHKVEEIAKATIDAIGIVNGPSHTEIMLAHDGPKVIETAARLGGDFITSKLIPLSTGVDFVTASVRLALGHDVDVKPSMSRGAAIRFMTADRPGVIKRIKLRDNLRLREGFTECEFYVSEGDRIDFPHSSNDRVGHVLFTGRDVIEATSRADEALSAVEIVVVEG